MERAILAARRKKLRETVSKGVILLPGQGESPRNYLANPYPFRQCSHFLYYTGLARPDLAVAMLPDGKEILFGAPEDPSSLIWNGLQPSLSELAQGAGIGRIEELSKLKDTLASFESKGAAVHYLPPYKAETSARLAAFLGRKQAEIAAGASRDLATAVVEQRSIKSEEEVAEIEEALSVTAMMYDEAMRIAEPGRVEAEVAGAMQGAALARDRAQAFLPIVSIRGEVLHNTSYANRMEDGDLLLIDSGAESANFYASDITRTIPVSGRFSEEQRAVYDAVLDAQLSVIDSAAPGVSYRDLHLVACRKLARGLERVGVMRGDPDEAVAQGAHALFFPHGIGHMLGLDVHDMEDLGDIVGYGEGEKRSQQFGLSLLRLAKKLDQGFVVTVEPGIYFVPALIERWAAEKKHEEFIDFAKVERFRGFGGIRIEDDILITESGCRVLGPGIPKKADHVEAAIAGLRLSDRR